MNLIEIANNAPKIAGRTLAHHHYGPRAPQAG
jgi:hypothetical protein